jgi:hypothetical protein
LVLAVVGGLALLFLTLALVGVWRLQKGPVSLGFLIPKLEEALNREISPLRVEVEDVTLELSGWRSPLDLRAREVSITKTTGDELLRLAELGIGLSFEALVRRELAVSSIDARGLAISVVRAEDGTFELDLAATAEGDTPTEQGLASWLDRWLDPTGPAAAVSELERISVSQGTLELADKGLGRTFRADNVELVLSREPAGLDATLDGVLHLGEGSVGLAASAHFPRQERRFIGRVELQGLQPSMLAWTGKVPECLQTLDPTLDATADLRFGRSFDLAATDFELTADQLQATGSVDLIGPTRALSIRLIARGIEPPTYASACKELRELERLAFPVDAQVDLQLVGQDLETLSLELTGGRGQLEVDELYTRPLAINGMSVKGHMENGLQVLFLDQAQVELEELLLEVQASAERRGESYIGSVEASVGELTVEQIHALWPEGAAEGARRWVIASIPKGEIHDLRATFAGGLSPKASKRLSIDELKVVFGYNDLEVVFLAPQPPVNAVDGTALFTKEQLDFAVERGRLEELEVLPSRVRITGLTSGIPSLAIHANLSGSVEPVVGVVTGEPLTIVPPRLLAGLTADLSNATLDLEIPLVSNDNAPPIDYSATAEVSNLFWPRAPGELEASGGEVSLRLDRRALEIRGDARFADVPTAIDYWENLEPGDPKRRVKAQARIDENDLRALGLPEQPYLSGPTELDVTVTQHRNRELEFDAKADLQETILAIPQIGWQKPAGNPGSATVTARKTAQSGWIIDPFWMEAGDLAAAGRLRMAQDRLMPREIKVDRLEIDGSRLHGELSLDERQGIDIYAAGSRLDLERILPAVRKWRKEASQSEQEEPGTARKAARSLSFDLDFDEIILSPEVGLTELSATGTFDGKRWRSFRAAAQIGDDSEGSIDLVPEEGEHRLTVRASDIGDVISQIVESEEMVGGTLKIDAARASPDDPIAGRFTVEDFRLRRSPAMLRLLSAVTLTKPLQNLQGEGLEFKVLTGNFTLEEGKLELTDTWAYGPGLHITADGWIDPRRRLGDVTGSLAWEGRVLRFLRKVPLIGQLVTGKDRKGLFATEFEITGSLDDPTVDTAVLGTLAPGFTRDVFNRLKRERKELKAERKAEKK